MRGREGKSKVIQTELLQVQIHVLGCLPLHQALVVGLPALFADMDSHTLHNPYKFSNAIIII